MKACPYCAELIQDAAVVCRWCGRELKDGSTSEAARSSGAVKEVGQQALEDAVTQHVALGWTVASRGERSVVLAKSHRINHVLHAILSIFTCALWLIVWFLLARDQYDLRRVISISTNGTLVYRDNNGPELPYAAGLAQKPQAGHHGAEAPHATAPVFTGVTTRQLSRYWPVAVAVALLIAVGAFFSAREDARSRNTPPKKFATLNLDTRSSTTTSAAAKAVRRGCLEHIELHSAAHTAKELGRTEMWTLANHRITLWQHPTVSPDRGRKVGEMQPGSRAVILRRDPRGSYRVESPLDESKGWVSDVQVARTLLQDAQTRQPCGTSQ